MELFHGSFETTAPIINYGILAVGDNIFEGLFASTDRNVAESHAANIFMYKVEKIADNSDLDCDEAVQALIEELEIDEALAIDILDLVSSDENLEDYAEVISPRSEYDDNLGWESQRLRGLIARKLGFDAVECEDEHGTSYLIVNKEIKGVSV